MNKFDNVPDAVPLDVESVLCLSIARACLLSFPSTLRKYARLKSDRLHLAIDSKKISPYGLVSAAYIGAALLPTSYRRFINETDRINKLELASPDFRNNEIARENSAAEEFGMRRGELKRVFARLDEFAAMFAAEKSYEAIFNCKNEILNDPSAFAPSDREAYAEGPLYVWDLAKAVSEHELVDMSFGTYRGWVFFVHRKQGVVSGHAIHPVALRFGDFLHNPLIDVHALQRSVGPLPIIDVPTDVREATKGLADLHFPGLPFNFVAPPLVFMGDVYRSTPILLDIFSPRTEA